MLVITVLFLILAVFLTIKNIKAQTHVDNKAYDVMLSTLLKHSVPEISVDSLQKNPNSLLLDTRAKPEFDVSHLQNARWVGYDEFDLYVVDSLEKNTPIVVYCSVGYRSEKIAEKLVNAGFTDVQNLYGGIFEWVNNGYPIVDQQGMPTQKIHAYSKSWGVWLKKGEKVY